MRRVRVMARSLGRLLRPRSIAVVGGGAWCANVIEQCDKIGFKGPIWPVHPTRSDLGGRKAMARVEDLPEAPDATFIGVNRDATVDVVGRLRAMGAGGAICFASGFREAEAELGGGSALQDRLLAAAGEMPIIGPNCYGLLNYLDGAALWPDQHGGIAVERGVAIITQSSNMAINLTMQTRGVPLAYVVTAGNQAQTGIADIGQALLSDDRVTALGLHIEGIGDLRAFEALADAARRLGKSVVALKVGASDQARAAAISHTASLAGSDAGARALLRRLGIGQVHSLAGFLEALKLLHVTGPLSSARIGSMSCSGGEASLMADSALGTCLEFPALSAPQRTALREALGPKVALANPLDYHTYIWGDGAALEACFSAMMLGDLGLGVVVIDFPRPDRCSAADWDLVIEAVASTQAKHGKPVALLASLAENMPELVATSLIERGIVPLCGLVEGIEAIATAADIGGMTVADEQLLLPHPACRTLTLDEAEAKAALAHFGLLVPDAKGADQPDAAATVASDIGFPVVLKGTGIAHKTEAGAVALNLWNADAVRTAAMAMATERFLVEEMITGAVAELLIGVVLDPAHGYVLTLAAGGTLTEVLRDSQSLLVPATADAVRAALDQLRCAALLKGYRGAPAADIDAIVDAVMSVQAYVAAHRPQEVEINPLLCCPDRAIAADALIEVGEPDDR